MQKDTKNSDKKNSPGINNKDSKKNKGRKKKIKEEQSDGSANAFERTENLIPPSKDEEREVSY
jgi:hypothetical protein